MQRSTKTSRVIKFELKLGKGVLILQRESVHPEIAYPHLVDSGIYKEVQLYRPGLV